MKTRDMLLLVLAASTVGLALPDAGCGQERPAPLTLTLRQGLAMAMEKNETLLAAREDLRKSREQVREATADALPDLNVSLTYGRTWLLPTFIFDSPLGRQSVTIGTHNNIDGVLSFRQPLFSLKTGAARQVARLFSEYSREGVRAARQQVRAEVETAFYDLLLARSLFQVSVAALDRARANRDQVEKLHRAGRVSDYELLRAEVQVSSLRPDSIRAQNAQTVAELNFKNAVGLQADRRVEITGSLERTSPLTGRALEDVVRLGLNARPEMRQMDRQLRMRQEAVLVARASSLPTLDLTASGQLQIQSNQFGFSRDDAHQSWASGVVLSFPLFDGFRTRSRVAQAQVDVRRAELENRQLQRNIGLQIRQVWLGLKEAQERLRAEERVVDQARRGLKIAESRYANGVGTQLEVLDAQLVLLQAETQYAREQHDRAVGQVNLEHVTGVLGEPEEGGS